MCVCVFYNENKSIPVLLWSTYYLHTRVHAPCRREPADGPGSTSHARPPEGTPASPFFLAESRDNRCDRPGHPRPRPEGDLCPGERQVHAVGSQDPENSRAKTEWAPIDRRGPEAARGWRDRGRCGLSRGAAWGDGRTQYSLWS